MSEANQFALADLYNALAKAQGEFKAIEKNKVVTIRSEKGSYNFKYADLEEILKKTRPALSANGIAVVQSVGVDQQGNMSLDLVICHSSGGTLVSRMMLPDPGQMADPKRFGAMLSYLRRYQYSAMLCVAADDDLDEDGSDVRDEEPVKKQQPRRKQPDGPPPQTPGPRDPEPSEPQADKARKVNEGEVAYLIKKCEAAGYNADELTDNLFGKPAVNLTVAEFQALIVKIRKGEV